MISTLREVLDIFPVERFRDVSTKEECTELTNQISKELIPQTEGVLKTILEKELEGDFNIQSIPGVKKLMEEFVTSHMDEISACRETFNPIFEKAEEENDFYTQVVTLTKIFREFLNMGLDLSPIGL